jgi:hypothetical protein
MDANRELERQQSDETSNELAKIKNELQRSLLLNEELSAQLRSAKEREEIFKKGLSDRECQLGELNSLLSKEKIMSISEDFLF